MAYALAQLRTLPGCSGGDVGVAVVTLTASGQGRRGPGEAGRSVRDSACPGDDPPDPDNGGVDDLGHPVLIARPARRVVSLVPSLTESVAATQPDALAGATIWCTQPAGLDVPRVRGTKNPDLAAIAALGPDVVLANQEENRQVDVERLRGAGIPVWVTVIRTLDEAFGSLRRMFGDGLGWAEPGWLGEAEAAWRVNGTGGPRRRAVIPVWRDPWMVVGSGTFTGDIASRLGLDNVYGDHPERYPHVTLDDIAAREPEVIVLPDEPYRFGADDGPEAFPERAVALVDGRYLTWYGPSLVSARSVLTAQLSRA
jgi:ABC-type Fe3+-hydroxamate transport system substrate-binding protein